MIEAKSIKLAFRNCASRKLMSFLSLMTVTLGAVALTATFIVNENVNSYIDAMVDRFGGPTLRIILRGPHDYFRSQDLEQFAKHPDVVAAFEYGTFGPIKIRYLEKFENADVVMIASDTLLKNEFMVSGRRIQALDEESNFVNLSYNLTQKLKLNPDDLAAEMFLTMGHRSARVRVAGVYKPDELLGTDPGTVYIPKNMFLFLSGQEHPKTVMIEATNIRFLDRIESHFKTDLLEPFRDRVTVLNAKTRVARTEKDLQNLVKAGIALGLISVLAGSLGMMNMMLLTIKIRKKEIGLYRALGFSSRQIMMQFFYEFLILSSFGAFLGVLIGIFAGQLLSRVVISPFDAVNPLPLFVGFFFTVTVSLIFAIFPARAAVKLEPVEALRG
jgi:putative ABC transport system permease protein